MVRASAHSLSRLGESLVSGNNKRGGGQGMFDMGEGLWE